MKHKRVLFGLLAAVAAMMFLFCGDSVVTTGTGNEVPGTTPGTDGGETILDENAFVLTNTSKGISVANRAKYVGKKTAQVASDINQALKIIQDYAPANAAISIQYGSGGGNTLNLGTTVGVFDENWGNAVASIKFAGTANGTLDFRKVTVSLSGKLGGNVTVIIDPANNYTTAIGGIVTAGKIVDPDGKTIEVNTDGTIVAPPSGGVSAPPTINNESVVWTSDDEVQVKFDISVNANVWLYHIPSSLGTPQGDDAAQATTIKFFGEKVNGNTPVKEIDEILTSFSANDRVGILVEDAKDASLFYIAYLQPTGLVLSGAVTDRLASTTDISINLNAYGTFGLYQVVRAYSASAPGLTADEIIKTTGSFVENWVRYSDASKVLTINVDITDNNEVWFVVVNVNNVTQISAPLNIGLIKDTKAPVITIPTTGSVRRGSYTFDPLTGTVSYPNPSTSATIKFSSDESVGDVYWKFVTDGSTPPADDLISSGSTFSLGSSNASSGTSSSPVYSFETGLAVTNAAGKIFLVAVDAFGNKSTPVSSFDVLAYVDDAPAFTPEFTWVIGGVNGASPNFSGSAKISFGDWSGDAVLDSAVYFVYKTSEFSGSQPTTFDQLLALPYENDVRKSWPSSPVALSGTFTSGADENIVCVGAVTKTTVWGGGVSHVACATLAEYNDDAPGFATDGEPSLVSRIDNTASFVLTTDAAGWEVYYKVSSVAITTVEYSDIVPSSGTSSWIKHGVTTVDGDDDPQEFPVEFTLPAGQQDVYFAVVNPNNGEVLFNETDSKVSVPNVPSAVSVSGFYAISSSSHSEVNVFAEIADIDEYYITVSDGTDADTLFYIIKEGSFTGTVTLADLTEPDGDGASVPISAGGASISITSPLATAPAKKIYYALGNGYGTPPGTAQLKSGVLGSISIAAVEGD